MSSLQILTPCCCPQSVLTPSQVVRALGRVDARWGDGSQQDSQELLHVIFESLQVGTITSKKPSKSCQVGTGQPRDAEARPAGTGAQPSIPAAQAGPLWAT